jgi:hypothetical protein
MTVLLRILPLVLAFAGLPNPSVLAGGASIGTPYSISKRLSPGDHFMGITLRGALRVIPQELNGLKPRELSGLAWDADENRLYALSDDGHIVHLRPTFIAETLIGLEYVDAFTLQNADGVPLDATFGDGEGLVGYNTRNSILADSSLLVSFGEHARIDRYLPDGTFVEQINLPRALSGKNTSKENKLELEAISDHRVHGLIAGPERPLKGTSEGKFTLHNLDEKVWEYSPLDEKYSALVGMESMQNGDLLLLERRYSSIFKPVIFALRRLVLSDDNVRQATVVEEVAHFNTKKGWKIDNFESVARHEGNRYFVISDDNENPIQKTLLLYFEIHSDTAANTKVAR